jgi:LytS/YehU family sensor histidine kinase
LDHYLNIEKLRLGDRLTILREIDPSCLDFYVPVLLIQPLVENAIVHGIAPQVCGGTVGIHVLKRGTSLNIRVHDTGAMNIKESGGQGIGLANTRARLQCLYGDRFDLSFVHNATDGAVVSLTLPCCEQPIHGSVSLLAPAGKLVS